MKPSAIRVVRRYFEVQPGALGGSTRKGGTNLDLNDFFQRHGSPSVLFDRNGGVSIPSYAGMGADPVMQMDLARATLVARASSYRFTTAVRINASNAAGFDVNPKNILETKSTTGDLIEKFSWNPVTGEVLFVHPPQQHVTAQGKDPFDDYVRAIVLHDRRRVLFRPFWPTWVRTSPYAEFDEEAAAVNFDAQWHAKEMVEAHGGAGWDIEMNTNNRALAELTGRRNW